MVLVECGVVVFGWDISGKFGDMACIRCRKVQISLRKSLLQYTKCSSYMDVRGEVDSVE